MICDASWVPQASGQTLREHVFQSSGLLGFLGDRTNLGISKRVTMAYGFHGLENTFRGHLLGQAFKSFVDDRLCWKPYSEPPTLWLVLLVSDPHGSDWYSWHLQVEWRLRWESLFESWRELFPLSLQAAGIGFALPHSQRLREPEGTALPQKPQRLSK